MSSAGCPFCAVNAGAFAVPPRSEIAGAPVRPWKLISTRVSARIGVAGSTAIVVMTRLGSCGSSLRLKMAPTRMPLNSTLDPVVSPETG